MCEGGCCCWSLGEGDGHGDNWRREGGAEEGGGGGGGESITEEGLKEGEGEEAEEGLWNNCEEGSWGWSC